MGPDDLDELLDLLRIPSVSAGPGPRGRPGARPRVGGRLRPAFGRRGRDRRRDQRTAGAGIGEIRNTRPARRRPSSSTATSTSSPPGPVELWETAPFEPTVRDGWLHCRGVADDKAQLWILLDAVRGLAGEGALPVNVRVVSDAEEEVGGNSVADWVAADPRGADACVVFDTAMLTADIPAFYLGTRGTAYFHVTVETGRRDVHSGVFGGAGLNAMHVLVEMLAAVTPRDGAFRSRCARTAQPGDAELASWRLLPQGEEVLADQGVLPADSGAAAEFYRRTWAEPSLDVHGLEGGSPG